MILTEHALSAAPLLQAIGEGGDLTNAALAERTGRNSKNMPRDLGRLRDVGWLTADPFPTLSDDGREILAALARANGEASPAGEGAAEIPLHLIDEDPDLNPRTRFADAPLEELAASIGVKGVLQPILVRPSPEPGRFLIVAGARRWRASKMAGLFTIPAVRKDLDDDAALEAATIENIQREDMSPLDEARAFARMIEARQRRNPDLTLKAAKEEIAGAVHKTVRFVELRLQLQELPEIQQVLLNEGKITVTEARKFVQQQPKLLKLDAAHWLLALEVYDRQVRAPMEKAHEFSREKIRVHAEAADDPRVSALGTSPLHMIEYPHRLYDGEGGTWQGYNYCGSPSWALTQLKLRFGDVEVEAVRMAALAAIRAEAGVETDLPVGRYATAWLNADDPISAETLANIEDERRQEAETEARRKAEAQERRDEAEAYDKAGADLLADVRKLEGVAVWIDDAFRDAFAKTWAKIDVAGPWSLAPTGDPRDPWQIVDSAGVPNNAIGAQLEARRRLMIIALNFAAGLSVFSGPDAAPPEDGEDDAGEDAFDDDDGDGEDPDEDEDLDDDAPPEFLRRLAGGGAHPAVQP